MFLAKYFIIWKEIWTALRNKEKWKTQVKETLGATRQHSLRAVDKENHSVWIPHLEKQMEILARDTAWLLHNTGYGYGIDYVKSGSSLDVLGESLSSEENNPPEKAVPSLPFCHSVLCDLAWPCRVRVSQLPDNCILHLQGMDGHQFEMTV